MYRRIIELEAALADAEEHRVKHLLRITELEALMRRMKRERHDAQCIDHLLAGLTCSCGATGGDTP